MTEQEWLDCADPGEMLDFLQASASGRKARLFAVACCRRIWDLLIDQRSHRAVETAELFAEGQVSESALQAALRSAGEVCLMTRRGPLDRLPWTGFLSWLNFFRPSRRFEVIYDDHGAANAACYTAWEDAWKAAHWSASFAIRSPGTEGKSVLRYPLSEDDEEIRFFREQLIPQAHLLRDVFNNPFRPVTFDPSWQALRVLALAQAIFDERAFHEMPELADALERAGCDHADILGHCRELGPHVRGCWVVDLILGKT